MTSYNRSENRDSLASHLAHCPASQQDMFLESLTSDVLRNDLKERINTKREQHQKIVAQRNRKARAAFIASFERAMQESTHG